MGPSMHLRTLATLAILSLSSERAAADVNIPGGPLVADTVWTAAEGPYYVNGDVVIPAGLTLTIEAGTLVRFYENDSQRSGNDTTRGEFIVRGALIVNGTSTAPVELGASAPVAGAWSGIIVDASATRLVLHHAAMYQASAGIDHRAPAAAVDTHDLRLPGLRVTAGAPRYQGVTIVGASYGVIVSDAASLTLVNCVIFGGTQAGIWFAPDATARRLTVTNCSLNARRGQYGIYLRAGATGAATITNTIVTGATTGIAAADATAVTASYNDVWGNTTNYQGVTAGPGSISASPGFLSTLDLHLAAGSPCIDVGTATAAPAFDRDGKPRPLGAGVDLGAYEFGMAPPCGNGVLDPGEACDDGNLTPGDGCDDRCQREAVDAGIDGPVELDAGVDGPEVDAVVDASEDAAPDASVDAVPDASVDAAAGEDAAAAGEDAGSQAGGCCSTGGTSRRTATFGALAVVVALGRRRRRRSAAPARR